MEQQDEEDNSTANAVSFPASVLKQNLLTGKSWKQLLDLSMITTTALSKKKANREETLCVGFVSELPQGVDWCLSFYGSWPL